MHGSAGPIDVQSKKRRMDWESLDLNANLNVGSSEPKIASLGSGKDRDRRKNLNGGETNIQNK